VDITTVTDEMIVMHDGTTVHRIDDLSPGTEVHVDGVAVRTLVTPSGELLSRFATVNDVHFGEVEAGRIDEHPQGPIQRVSPEDTPYPETMNHGAVAEIADIGTLAVFVKGRPPRTVARRWAALRLLPRRIRRSVARGA
jgi:hypothetical protein